MTLLSKENLHWQSKAREVAEKFVRPLAKKYDEAQEYPWEIKEAIADAGLFGVWIPEKYGGSGKGEHNVLNLCLVIEQLSRACGGVGVLFAVNALGSFPILVGGTEEQKKKYLPRIASGDSLIAFCLSEKFAGSDAQGQKVRAVKSGSEDSWSIHGEKKWTTNGGAADIYTVFAVTDPESKSRRISGFIVEKDDPGFSIGKVEDKMGIRCAPVVETVFDGVKVGPDRILGGKLGLGFRHAMGTLDLARPGVASQAMGLAQGALELATRYAMRRKQFGEPVASFQMVQKMMADAAMKTEAARQLIYAAGTAIDNQSANVTKLSALSKCFATDVAMEVTTDAVQIFGGYGYMRDYPIEKYMRDAKITQIYEGTNQIQRLVIARNLMKEASELGFLDEYIPEEIQDVYEA